MAKRRTFVERVLAGEIYDLRKVDDEIDAWHKATGPEEECELHAWLGLTEQEYAVFVAQPDSLRAVLNVRKHSTDP